MRSFKMDLFMRLRQRLAFLKLTGSADPLTYPTLKRSWHFNHAMHVRGSDIKGQPDHPTPHRGLGDLGLARPLQIQK